MMNRYEMTHSVYLVVTSYGAVMVTSGDPKHDPEGWVRISEPVEITFSPLTEERIVAAQLAAIDLAEEKLRSDFADKIAVLNNKRDELRALTHMVTP